MAVLTRLRRLLRGRGRYPRDINLGCCHRRDGNWRAGPAPRRRA